MTGRLVAGEPVDAGGRILFPLIRETMICSKTGSFASREPVAILFSDGSSWFFAPLEPGITADAIGQLDP